MDSSTIQVPGPSSIDELIPGPSYFEDDGDFVDRHLNVDEILNLWSITRLKEELSTQEQCKEFAEAEGMVRTERLCRTHRSPMSIAASTNRSFGSWICTKRSCKGKTKVVRTEGTFFENVKIPVYYIFYLIYAFARRLSYDMVIGEDPWKRIHGSCLSRVTICDWYSYCREFVSIFTIDKAEAIGKIGGPGKIVQIDESKFGKRKYNRGRHIEGHWVIGMIEDGSEDLQLEVCPDNIRSADVLVPLIQKHVAPGTNIHTDFWRAYDTLGAHGYIHKKVNPEWLTFQTTHLWLQTECTPRE